MECGCAAVSLKAGLLEGWMHRVLGTEVEWRWDKRDNSAGQQVAGILATSMLAEVVLGMEVLGVGDLDVKDLGKARTEYLSATAAEDEGLDGQVAGRGLSLGP